MDKILSARVDETIIRRIGVLAQELDTTKKAVIEAAILSYADKIEAERKIDVLEKTLGAWKRKESAEEDTEHARRAFQKSMERHQI